MRNRLRPAIGFAVVALFTVPAVAACGGGDGSGGVASLDGSSGSDADATTTTTSDDPQDAALKFTECMRKHGVDMPDPSAAGGIRLTVRPGNQTKVDAAQKACQPLLQAAAPKPWVELSRPDAERLGVTDGDLVEVASARGSVRVPARIKDIREGAVFLPFHYGYWDTEDGKSPDGTPRAANELTITDWDPNSKQPLFKAGAVSVAKVGS